MIYLLLAILCSALVTIVMRVGSSEKSGNLGMLAINYLICLILSGFQAGYRNLFPAVPELPRILGMGAVNGTLFLLGFLMLQHNIRRNGVVLSSIFMKLGLLVPMVVSIVLFGEMPGVWQILGFLLAVAAIVLMNLEPGVSSGKFRPGLILLLLAGGCCDTMAKVYDELGSADLSGQYLFYTFAVALLLCLVVMVCKKERFSRASFVDGTLLAIPNYFFASFLLLALNSLDAVVVYPTYSVGTILVTTLAGVIFFREKLKKRMWIAVGIILAAMVLLNL